MKFYRRLTGIGRQLPKPILKCNLGAASGSNLRRPRRSVEMFIRRVTGIGTNAMVKRNLPD